MNAAPASGGWRNFFTPFRDRLQRWALKRQGPDLLPLRLAARRLYILPSRAGFAFGGLIGVAFIAGTNYGNGLAMLLAFWLAGFLLAAMLQTHRTLAGLQLPEATVERAFAGGSVTVRLRLRGPVTGANVRAADRGGGKFFQAVPHPDASGDSLLELRLPARRRGAWRAPVLMLETTAPYGLFRCWTWLQLDIGTVVYPQPLGDRPVPESPGDNAGHLQLATGQDELTWLRSFRDGDSPRQVAWKAYARGMPLLVREYRGESRTSRELRFDLLADLATEQRLSQLCRWVIDAAARGEASTLYLPGADAMDGAGALHRERCLEALALYDEAAAR